MNDPVVRTPALEITAETIELAGETGVLLSSDGPDQNVLEDKPPMPFSMRDAVGSCSRLAIGPRHGGHRAK